jgi:NAD-dependent DNA ligase
LKTYYLNYRASEVPAWHCEPATTRQLKVLRFFGTDISKPLTKGKASGIIGGLFSEPDNKHLWAAYVYTTGDEDHMSADLRPYDKAVLAQTEIPADWRPVRSNKTPSKTLTTMQELVTEILTDGSPFDDPLPQITIIGTTFCFTGGFEFGTRKECQAAILSRGGIVTDRVTEATDVLVIGHDSNPNWSHSNYGNKICAAMIRKLQHRKPIIIPELYWKSLLQNLAEPTQTPTGVGGNP